MKHMVSYPLEPDRVAENERYVRAVFMALRQARPSGLRYPTHAPLRVEFTEIGSYGFFGE